MRLLKFSLNNSKSWSLELCKGESSLKHKSNLKGTELDDFSFGYVFKAYRLYVTYLSEDDGFDFLGKTLFSRCKVALTSLLPAQVHAFQKLFLKLSLRNA